MSSDTTIAISDKLVQFAQQLSPNERDDLKYRLSVASVKELENGFDISHDPKKLQRFFELLCNLVTIQPFYKRIPIYGIVYRGRPDFITDELVQDLCAEALRFRPYARVNFEQFLITVDTPDDSMACERLAASEELHHLVTKYAGPCVRSYITSYIYYEIAGQCSKPHVDNAFTAITVMVGLRRDYTNATTLSSASIVYWPDYPPMEYRLEPGELVIFYGVSVLHGRSPIADGELVHSLLLSFRPDLVEEVSLNGTSPS